MLTPPGKEEGRGFEEGHYFGFFCVDLHAILKYSSVDRNGAWIVVRVDILT